MKMKLENLRVLVMLMPFSIFNTPFEKKNFESRPVSSKPAGGFGRNAGGSRFNNANASFEDKLSRFLKDSDERLTDLSRKTDSKRGGRGGGRRR